MELITRVVDVAVALIYAGLAVGFGVAAVSPPWALRALQRLNIWGQRWVWFMAALAAILMAASLAFNIVAAELLHRLHDALR